MTSTSAHDDIVAVVVTHQSAETIDDCLTRLRHAPAIAQIRVVDNDSRDGTLAIVQRHAAADPRLHFIGNPDNPGFSVACNQGAHDSTAPWIAFVNPDCLVEATTLARMRAHAQAFDTPVLLGADLVDEAGKRDGAARRRDPDFGGMLAAIFGAGMSRPLDIPVDDAQSLQHVDAISGALMLMSRSLFEQARGFDEGYRLHAEDLDLCRRARGLGAVVAVANDVQVVHVRGVSSRARPLFVEWHKHRGLARYFRTFEAPHRNLFTRMAVYAAIWMRFPFAALRATRL
ncbi:MAG: glycosyltransferase family 2 protein [Luteimonas sp.]